MQALSGDAEVPASQIDVYKRQGLTTLGANTFSMAIFGPFVSYGLFQLLKKCKAPMGLAVFLSATIGDMATYCLTSVQLAAAYPGDNFWASFGKFIAVFAPTQVPIAIAEGILTVIVYNVCLLYTSER